MYHDLDLSDMETALAAQNGRFHREQPPDYELEVDEADAPYGPRVDEEAQYACVTRRSRVDTVRQKNKRRKKRSKSMEIIIDVMATLMCAP
ncbi:unnamed protein product [Cyprideis torosa]|uniref:Uncharacterized protein n=1 Tax=Cyprideis torosa TaxID=163714 RepID=A0A7R8WTX2_9CRUS|nr:unnamed protein product [Cyprideis torosa]CAG0909936.1 unnamed protein product [Cyprideis torosa]